MRGARKGPAISPSPGRSDDPCRIRRQGRIPSGPGAPAAPGTPTAASSAPSSDPRAGIDGADTRPERLLDVPQCADAGSILESVAVSAENGGRPITRNRGMPDNAGPVIERVVVRLKDFFAAEMREAH